MEETVEQLRPLRLERAAFCARLLTLLALLGLFVATHLPVALTPSTSGHSDKFLHVTAYMILALCALTSWELTVGTLRPPHYFTVWLLGTLYGLFDEITQIPFGRCCEGADWIADVLGLIAGLALFRLTRPLIYRLVRITALQTSTGR